MPRPWRARIRDAFLRHRHGPATPWSTGARQLPRHRAARLPPVRARRLPRGMPSHGCAAAVMPGLPAAAAPEPRSAMDRRSQVDLGFAAVARACLVEDGGEPATCTLLSGIRSSPRLIRERVQSFGVRCKAFRRLLRAVVLHGRHHRACPGDPCGGFGKCLNSPVLCVADRPHGLPGRARQ